MCVCFVHECINVCVCVFVYIYVFVCIYSRIQMCACVCACVTTYAVCQVWKANIDVSMFRIEYPQYV